MSDAKPAMSIILQKMQEITTMFVVSRCPHPTFFHDIDPPFGFVVGIDYISGLAVSVASTSPIMCIDDRSTTDLFFFGSYK